MLPLSIFFPLNQLLACLYALSVSPSDDQLTSHIMNINDPDVIMLPDYCQQSFFNLWCQSYLPQEVILVQVIIMSGGKGAVSYIKRSQMWKYFDALHKERTKCGLELDQSRNKTVQ